MDYTRTDLDVLMVPMPGSYTDEFVDGLEAHGGAVRTSKGLFRVVNGMRNGGIPDVVHVHFLDRFFLQDSKLQSVLLGISFLFELCIARLLGVTVVWTVHNLHNHENPHPRIEYFFRHLTAYFCNSVIVHCDVAGEIITAEYHLPTFVRKKIQTVPHGNYTERYPNNISRDEGRRELDLNDDDFVFLLFGQIRPYKQVDELVRTFKRLESTNAKLLVVGKPTDEELVSEVAALSENDDRVQTVFEFIPDEGVQLYMHASDIVVLPYRSILTSGTVLLAMTFETPVIAPKLGCVSEILDTDGGFPYDPDEEDALLKALERATTTSLEGMGEYNRSKIDHLDWHSIARQTIQVYNR